MTENGKLVAIGGPNPELVKKLESVLERARRGEVRAFALAYQDNESAICRLMHAEGGSIAHLNLAIDWLKNLLVTNDD